MAAESSLATQPLTELPSLAPRQTDGHKGCYGHGLFIGGSRGMSGAISLAAQGALRSGIGLATVATADRCLETVAAFCPVYMVLSLPDDEAGRISDVAVETILAWQEKADVFVVGPGLGQSAMLQRLMQRLYFELAAPLIVDADGLNNLSATSDWSLLPSPAPRILTPHPGEMQRLTGVASSDRDGQRQAAVALAKRIGGVVVLKGHRTWVTDGTWHYENRSGNPAMAAGGSGDVLTGVIAALLGQGLPPFPASVLAVYWHGVAGDMAHQAIGGVSVLATDLVQYLPPALAKLKA